MSVTKKEAQQFVDMLNDYVCDHQIKLPGIDIEKARETARAPLNEEIKQMLKEVVEVLK